MTAWRHRLFITVGIVLALACLGGIGYVGYLAWSNPNQPAASLQTSQPTPDLCTPVGAATIAVQVSKHWLLITPSQTKLEPLDVAASVENVDNNCLDLTKPLTYSLKGSDQQGELASLGNGHYQGSLSLSDLEPGRYGLTVATTTASGQTVNGSTDVFVSYPLYVLWTLDWEGFDFKNEYLDQINNIAQANHQMPLSHFFNPRYFVGKSISSSRRKYFVAWVTNRQKKYNDSVDLHIHAFNDLVSAAGVQPHSDKQWSDRNDGYDVPLASYSAEDQEKIIAFSLNTLKNVGFNDIQAFRAGGWYANQDTLAQISSLGFAADASGRTAYTFGQNKIPGYWKLTSTTQPYHPCRTDQNNACSGSSALPIWEIPDNGADSYAYSADALKQRFDDNFQKKALTKTTVVTYLSHPEWFYRDDPKMQEVFKHIDQYTLYRDSGPVQYVTIHQLLSILEK